MYVTESDVQMLEASAIRRAAVVAGLGGDFLLPDDVLASLRAAQPELGAALDEFLRAFRAWYEFHGRVDAAGVAGKLPQREVSELVRLVQRKDAARARFVALVSPAPEEVPAFVEQCLEPMLTHVRIEGSYVDRRVWTWRFHMGACELLLPLEGLARRVLASPGVLVAGLRAAVPRHDAALVHLVDALAGAQHALESSPDFVRLAREHTEAHRSAHPHDAPWGAFPEDRMPQLAAQFVLNNVEPGTSSDSTMLTFWSERGRALVEAAEPTMAFHRPRIDAAGNELGALCRTIEEELIRVRGLLSSAYGV